MNTEFSLLNKNLQLHRWPLGQKNRSLQAWDSADEYLISYAIEQQLLTADSKLLIINDNFGVLSCFFSDHQLNILLDSYVSMQGIKHNLTINQPIKSTDKNLKSTTFIPSSILSSKEALPDVDLVLIKIPKNNAYLAALLAKLAANINPSTTIIAAGKTTDIHNSTLKLFEQHLGTTTTSLAKKKSRLIFSKLEKNDPQPLKPSLWSLNISNAEDHNLTLVNHANVFSGESLDIGARLFIEHLPNCNDKTVIDLGCGNGVIGATIMKLFNPKAVKLVDESFAAVKSAQDTIEYNFNHRSSVCEFIVDDCLTKQDSNSADVVLCNPPFHQQQAVTDHIAWQMFKDAHRVLKPGGLFCIVGNRNQSYHIKLKRLFGHCQQIASNKKFVVLQTRLQSH